MKKLAVISLIALACAPQAWAGPCGLPDSGPLWIDYAEGSVSFRNHVFGRPGVIAATSGTLVPRELRARGAVTAYWQMKVSRLVGTPSLPADPAAVQASANALFDRAADSSGCATPLIGLEELSGAHVPAPWSPSNDLYRENVLMLVEVLAARGARPFVFVHGRPTTAGDTAAWWWKLAQSADIVYEAYYNARRISALGPHLGSRRLRLGMRTAVGVFTAIGIPPERLGIMLGFHSKPGTAGREGLQPREAWLEYVKLNALAARQVAADEGLGSIWSWGWGTFDAAGADPDKPLAACVYLWTRDATLCDAPSRAAFDTSLTAGQLLLPEGIRCAFPAGMVPDAAVGRLARFAGGERAALTALVQRRALRRAVAVPPRLLLRAERAHVARRYGGSYWRYRSGLARRGLRPADAHAFFADRIRVQLLGRAVAEQRLTAAVDSALCVEDELPARTLVDLASKL